METKTPIHELKPDHPEFRYALAQGAEGLPVFVFDRRLHKQATPEQLAALRMAREAVRAAVEEANRTLPSEAPRIQVFFPGEVELAGKNDPFSDEDCKAMTEAVAAVAEPHGWRVHKTGKGSGLYTFSVSVTTDQ